MEAGQVDWQKLFDSGQTVVVQVKDRGEGLLLRAGDYTCGCLFSLNETEVGLGSFVHGERNFLFSDIERAMVIED